MRLKIDSLNEIPEDKRPPRDLWWKPYKLKEWLDNMYKTDSHGDTGQNYIDLNLEDVE